MKKIVSILLCIIMLLGVMSTYAFALDYYAGESDSTAPVIDGKVEEGEYTWTSGRFSTQSNIPGKVGVVVTPKYNAKSQFYLSYDDEYIYMAYEEYNVISTIVWFRLNPRVGLSGDTAGQVDVYVTTKKGSGSTGSVAPAANIVRVYKSADEKSDVTPSTYLEELKCGWYDDGKANTNTVEIKIKRSALEEYAGGEFDKLGFRGLMQGSGDGSLGEVYYADENSEFKAFAGWTKYGYHVINLNNDGENPVVSSSCTTIDGIISEDEYSFASDVFDRNENVGNQFSVITEHSDTATQLYSQFLLNYDEEYLYIAYKERGGYKTTVSLDINPSLGDTQILIPIEYTRASTPTANTGHDILSTITPRVYSADGDYTEDTTATYIKEAKASWYDDGLRNNNIIELKLSMAALEAYAGVDIKEIGFRGIVTSSGEAVYCSVISDVEPLDVHTDKKYHVFELNGVNDVTEKEFEIDPDHQHSFDDWSIYSETHHMGICMECGTVEHNFHEWDDGVEAGDEITYTCVVCGATDVDEVVTEAPVVTDPVVTDPVDTEPTDTTPTSDTETEPADTEILVEKDGCGASVSAVAVAFVMMLGTCVTFVTKKR